MRILVAIFESRKSLIEAVDHLMEAELIKVGRTAVIAKAHDGETVVVDNQITANEAGLAGGTFGAALGALGMTQIGALVLPGVGPIIALSAGALFGAMLGRQTGRVAAQRLNIGFTEEQVADLASNLDDGQAALLVEVDTEQAFGKLKQFLSKFEARTIDRVEHFVDTSV